MKLKPVSLHTFGFFNSNSFKGGDGASRKPLFCQLRSRPRAGDMLFANIRAQWHTLREAEEQMKVKVLHYLLRPFEEMGVEITGNNFVLNGLEIMCE